MIRRLALVAALLSFMLPTAVLAGSPHEVHSTTISISGGTVTASGKEAGLGDEDQVHIVMSFDAECINPGNNKPQASNKESFSVEGDFPVQNGKTVFSLSATASFSPSCSPPMSVRISNVIVTDTTNGIQLYP